MISLGQYHIGLIYPKPHYLSVQAPSPNNMYQDLSPVEDIVDSASVPQDLTTSMVKPIVDSYPLPLLFSSIYPKGNFTVSLPLSKQRKTRTYLTFLR